MSKFEKNQVIIASFSELEQKYSRYVCVLTEEEHNRKDCFQSLNASRKFVLSRVYLKLLLCEFIGVRIESIIIRQEERGKPFLVGEEFVDIDFNISHAKDLLAIAITRGARIGIDIEYVEYNTHIKSIAENFFSHEEQQLVITGLNKGYYHPFYRLWTRREAFLKGIGHGIAWLEDWKETSFHNDYIICYSPTNRWNLVEIDVRNSYCCSLSYTGNAEIEVVNQCK